MQEPLKVIEFKSPPPKGPRKTQGQRELEESLRSNPGKWALVAKNTYPTKGKKYEDDPEYELRRVFLGNNRYDIYMRYMGAKGKLTSGRVEHYQ